MRPNSPLILTLLLSSTLSLFASTLSQTTDDATLVIYNSNLGLVHEEKSLTLKKGLQTITYPGVATTVQTDSVNVQFPEAVSLFSQQYRYDKITLKKILQAHIGKEVEFKSGPKEKQVLKQGTLLATDPAVIKTDEGISGGIADSDILFSSIPSELIMRPSLMWNVDVDKDVQGTLSLDYLITGISWKSDYVIDLGKDTADLSGWITVDNRSGKRFEDVKMHLLAGDINRVSQMRSYSKAMPEMDMVAAAPVAHQAHEGYHFYSIPFKVTVADREKTQVKFIDKKEHSVKRHYKVRMNSPFHASNERKKPVSRYIELAPFSMPLPKGTVRTYSQVNETTVLLGETHLPNTPKGEKVNLRLGTDFDIIAKEKLKKRDDDKHYTESTVEYTLSNRSDTTKSIEMTLPGVTDNARSKTTIKSDQKYDRPDGHSIRFKMTLKADETRHWDVTVRMKR